MTSHVRSRWVSLPLLIAVLLVTAAGLFAIGVAAEHRADRAEHSAVTSPGSDEHGDSAEEPGTESAEESGDEAHAGEAAGSERLLGVSADSPGTVVVVVLGSVLLAVVVARYPRPSVVAAVAVLAAGATVFDIAWRTSWPKTRPGWRSWPRLSPHSISPRVVAALALLRRVEA